MQNKKQTKDKIKFKNKEIYILKCLECGKYTPKTTGRMCWEKWQLCGNCAPVRHPNMYGPRQRNVNHYR